MSTAPVDVWWGCGVIRCIVGVRSETSSSMRARPPFEAMPLRAVPSEFQRRVRRASIAAIGAEDACADRACRPIPPIAFRLGRRLTVSLAVAEFCQTRVNFDRNQTEMCSTLGCTFARIRPTTINIPPNSVRVRPDLRSLGSGVPSLAKIAPESTKLRFRLALNSAKFGPEIEMGTTSTSIGPGVGGVRCNVRSGWPPRWLRFGASLSRVQVALVPTRGFIKVSIL